MNPQSQLQKVYKSGGSPQLAYGSGKKMAAHPENVDQQLLLAQTYNELGNHDKGIQLLQSLTKKLPSNVELKMTLATMLMIRGPGTGNESGNVVV